MNIRRPDEKEIPCCMTKAVRIKAHFKNYGIQMIVDEFANYYTCLSGNGGIFHCKLCIGKSKPFMAAHNVESYDNYHVISNILSHLSCKHIRNKGMFKEVACCITFTNKGINNLLLSERNGSEGRGYSKVTLNCRGILKKYSQLLFITPIDKNVNLDVVLNAIKNTTETDREYISIIHRCEEIGQYSEAESWFARFLENCNYKCTNCKEYYEDGMPS